MNVVLEFINERLGDCSPKIKNQIGIAVDEIFSNISRCAYHPGVGAATVRIAVDDDVTIEFEDSGTAFNPLSAKEPDITAAAEKRKIGGLGIFMVRKIMDSVTYQRQGSKNVLTIKKKLL